MLQPMAVPTLSSIGEGHSLVGGASCPGIPVFTINSRTKQLPLAGREECRHDPISIRRTMNV